MADALGYVGLGVMGAPMARRLCEAGHRLVVQTRTQAHMRPLLDIGAQGAATPAAVADRCGIVFSCLRNSDVIRSVYLGADGLMSAPRPGHVFVEHGTFSPALAQELSRRAAEAGALFIDAPVTGGPDGAHDGTLVIMAGGPAETVDSIRDLLACYSQRVVHIGASGSGLQLKLVNQLLVSCHVAAAAEAAALVRRLPLPHEAAIDVLTSGWASSAMLSRCLPAALGNASQQGGASVGGLHELGDLISALAAEVDMEPTVYSAAARLLRTAESIGLGGQELASLVKVFDSPPRGEVSDEAH